MDKVRIHAVFHGEVQGVGFRYTARQAANALGLTGWVRNEYDGSVSAEIQGDRDSIRIIEMNNEDIAVSIVGKEEIAGEIVEMLIVCELTTKRDPYLESYVNEVLKK